MLKQLKPEVVVVLGDLFAEGYKASEVYWWDYLQVGQSQREVESVTMRLVHHLFLAPFPCTTSSTIPKASGTCLVVFRPV